MKKKEYIKNSIGVLVILSFMLVFLSGCSKNDTKNVRAKTEEEIKYLENRVVAMANKINNISFSNYGLVESKQEQSSDEGKSSQESSGNSQSGSSQNSGSSGGEQEGGESGNSGSEGKSDSSGDSSNSQTESAKSETKYGLKQESILLSGDTDVDWDYLKYNAELLYSTWTTIIIDLHSLNVDNNDILSFGNSLDNLIIAVKNEDKVKTLNLLSELYSYIPKYVKQYSEDTKEINLSYTKYYVVNAYTLSEENKWDEMKKQIGQSKDYFSNIINGVNDNSNSQNKENKIYVLLNELDNSINIRDKELFYIKYKALMENINDI